MTRHLCTIRWKDNVPDVARRDLLSWLHDRGYQITPAGNLRRWIIRRAAA